jgi:hypothetical protein
MINSMDEAQKAASALVETIAGLVATRDNVLESYDRAMDRVKALEAQNTELYAELQTAGVSEKKALDEARDMREALRQFPGSVWKKSFITSYIKSRLEEVAEGFLKLYDAENRTPQNDMGENPQESEEGRNASGDGADQGQAPGPAFGFCIKGAECPVCNAGLVAAPVAAVATPPAVTDWGPGPANSQNKYPTDSPAESTGPRPKAPGSNPVAPEVKLQSLTAVYALEVPEPDPFTGNVGMDARTVNEIYGLKAPKNGASYARDVERQAEVFARATGCPEKGLIHRLETVERFINEFADAALTASNAPRSRLWAEYVLEAFDKCK